MAKQQAKESRLNREAWLERALQVLRDEGIQGVRVERMARDLGVTKGSFYWHFVDRDDLFSSMLEYWIQSYTDVVVMNDDFSAGDPAAGLLAAITKVRQEKLEEYELAIRAWANQEPKVADAVREVYRRRSNFVREFFTRLGFEGPDAEIRTRLTLCYLSWERNMYQGDSEANRIEMLELQHGLLTKKLQ